MDTPTSVKLSSDNQKYQQVSRVFTLASDLPGLDQVRMLYAAAGNTVLESRLATQTILRPFAFAS